MQVGDLVRTPKVSTHNAEYAMRAGLGVKYYDWEGRLGVVVGFSEEKDSRDNSFVMVRVQDTGKLCTFSVMALTRVE